LTLPLGKGKFGGVATESDRQLLTIGEFAYQARLTARALRIYDETGLLRPAEVDPCNGYRRYGADQVGEGRLIGMLRAVDMGLAEIGQLLADLHADRQQAGMRLDEHLGQLEARHASRRLLIRHIHATLREEDSQMYPIQTRHVPAQRVMTIQRRLRVSEMKSCIQGAKAALASHLSGIEPPGPLSYVFHGVINDESDGLLEITLGCPDDVQPTDVIGIRTEPAHDEAYTTITKAQWDYPAILAAYDAVAGSPEVRARPRSPLSCREVYLAEPDAIGNDDLICDIAFPLGEEAEPAVPGVPAPRGLS
jgi:DNA-binding transcriptional MerR regulator